MPIDRQGNPRHEGTPVRRTRLFLLGPGIGLAVLLGATLSLRRELDSIRISEVMAAIHRISPLTALLATLMTVFCYLVLTMYDALAFRYLRISMGFARIVFAAFIGYALSNNLSMTPSVVIRYRIYSAWGVGAGEFARIILFHLESTYLGFFVVAGLTLSLERLPELPGLHPPAALGRGLGAFFLALIGAYVIWVASRPNPIHFRNQVLEVPSLSLTAVQIALSSADWALTGSVLYLLFPETLHLSYGHYLMIYLVAQVVGINSHLPGGLGAFEGTCILLLSPFLSMPTIVGALLLYRVTYYLLPLAIGAILLLIFEIDQRDRAKGAENSAP